MDSDGRQWWLFLIIYMTGFVVTGDTYVWERVEAEVEELITEGGPDTKLQGSLRASSMFLSAFGSFFPLGCDYYPISCCSLPC